MILAVALRAEYDLNPAAYQLKHGDTPPPPYPRELTEYWRFLDYHLPPLAGGQRDQPAMWFERAQDYATTYDAWQAWLSSDMSSKWREAHPAYSKRVKYIEKLRKTHGQ